MSASKQTPTDDKLMRCTICGFIVDTSYAAEKPTCDFTTRGRAKKGPEGQIDIIQAFSHAAIRDAMQSAWDTICSDTGCHPLDIRHEGKKLFFEPRHWADLVAKLLFRNAIKERLTLSEPAKEPL